MIDVLARSVAHSLQASLLLILLAANASATEVRTDLSEQDRQRVIEVTRPATDFSKAEDFEAMQGGAGTLTTEPDRNAFTHAASNLDWETLFDFELGKAIFEKFWVASPSSTQASDGLGPLFNAKSCHSCHLRNGRGEPPTTEDPAASFLLRLARPAETDEEKEQVGSDETLNFPDPVYGHQLQDAAVPGLSAEGRIAIRYSDMPVALSGRETVTLRNPEYSVHSLAYGPLSEEITLSPRIAQPMIGLGLMEAIAEADILANSDPDDADGDGISGRPAMVKERGSDHVALGRFGWKAEHATVRGQSAAAANFDIGISTPPWPDAYGDCTINQMQCLDLPSGVQQRLGKTEAPDPVLDLLTTYAASLAVPARRDVENPEVLSGKRQFYAAGCAACHMPKFVTQRDAPHPGADFQLIWPYSDFLLHDMGDGLADGQQVGRASGREWRTAPLWGIGLTETVNGRNAFLHDGRARTLEEAILWHGGEAETAKTNYVNMDRKSRQSMIRFLESL